MKTRKLGKFKQTLVSCPIKNVRCVAIRPRWVYDTTLRKQAKNRKGICNSCKRRYTLKDAQRIAPKALKLRVDRDGKNEVFISCPLRRYNCLNPNPRWVNLSSIIRSKTPGGCKSCRQGEMGYITFQGYRYVSLGRNKNPVLEHRLVMEKLLGRKLLPGETVHHGPGGRADNRPENLSLRAPGKHPKGWSPAEMLAYLKTVPKSLGGLK